MSQNMDFDRVAADWLKSDGPPDIRLDSVERSLATARQVGQRRGLLLALVGPAPWPTYGRRIGFGTMPPAVRVAIVLALALAMALGAALVGSRIVRPIIPPPTSSDAIFLSPVSDAVGADIDVLAVRPGAQPRLITRVSSSIVPDGRSLQPSGSVSEDGWLSLLTNRDEWALIDLANPSTTPALYLSGSGPSTAWSPNGRLAFPVPDRKATPWTLQVVDARTGVSSTIGPMGLPGGGPSTVWAVDGSAILDVGYSPFRMRPIDGGRPIEGVPALAWRGARSIAQGGDSFDGLCPSGTQDPGCAGRPVLRVDRANGDQLDWWSVDDNPTDEDVVSASFSVDGRSIWLLADRVDGQRHTAVLLRSTAPHEATQVAAIDVGTHVVVSLQGFAPDDSVVAVWHGSQSGSEIVDYQVTILSVADDRSSNYALTRWAGFMPSSLVDSLISQGASR